VNRRAAVALAVASSLVVACGRAAPAGESITVLAAASLTESFEAVRAQFRIAHPGTEVVFSFDASATLVQQVKNGAPADVLATADEASMHQAFAVGAVTAPSVFARNRLTILVAPHNPKGVRSLADLARPDVVVVLCGAEVPCGRFAQQALSRAGVAARPRSLEPNVKGVVAKVTMGEADAGIVYVSDAHAAGRRAEAVAIPPEHNAAASSSIATLSAAPNPTLADAFVAFVRSGDGRAVLSAAGLEPA
jgi:molybdate transport system substrate-binding protein